MFTQSVGINFQFRIWANNNSLKIGFLLKKEDSKNLLQLYLWNIEKFIHFWTPSHYRIICVCVVNLNSHIFWSTPTTLYRDANTLNILSHRHRWDRILLFIFVFRNEPWSYHICALFFSGPPFFILRAVHLFLHHCIGHAHTPLGSLVSFLILPFSRGISHLYTWSTLSVRFSGMCTMYTMYSVMEIDTYYISRNVSRNSYSNTLTIFTLSLDVTANCNQFTICFSSKQKWCVIENLENNLVQCRQSSGARMKKLTNEAYKHILSRYTALARFWIENRAITLDKDTCVGHGAWGKIGNGSRAIRHPPREEAASIKKARERERKREWKRATTTTISTTTKTITTTAAASKIREASVSVSLGGSSRLIYARTVLAARTVCVHARTPLTMYSIQYTVYSVQCMHERAIEYIRGRSAERWTNW